MIGIQCNKNISSSNLTAQKCWNLNDVRHSANCITLNTTTITFGLTRASNLEITLHSHIIFCCKVQVKTTMKVAWWLKQILSEQMSKFPIGRDSDGNNNKSSGHNSAGIPGMIHAHQSPLEDHKQSSLSLESVGRGKKN